MDFCPEGGRKSEPEDLRAEDFLAGEIKAFLKISFSRTLFKLFDYLIGYENWGNSKMGLAA